MSDWGRELELDESSHVRLPSGSGGGFSILDDDISESIAEAKRISANTSDKAYRALTAKKNATSYSLLSNLHACPRAFELDKLQANSETLVDTGSVNYDFAFGHCVGAGIQTFAATKSLLSAQFSGFLAWKAPWDGEKLTAKGYPAGKSLAHGMIAIEKFAKFWDENLSEWEVVRMPNGKPATELAFAVDFENGFHHFGHIDTVLRHKTLGTLAVWEGKTTGLKNINEAMYANSSQALGYSVVVDKIAELIGASGTEYEVLYIVYSTAEQEFKLLPFGKTRTQRAEWLQDTLLDHANISTYQRIGFYPKRGESCINQYGRTCHWFGQCTMSNASLFPGVTVAELQDVGEVESLDFVFTLSELVAAQKAKS